MNVVLEILSAIADAATIWLLLFELLDRWREHRHQRMTKGEKKETGGHQSL